MKRNVDDNQEKLRRYLLGRSSAVEVEAVENALLNADDSLFDELMSVEEELIDEVADGALSASDAAAFREYVTKLPDRRHEVWIATELARSPHVPDASLAPHGRSRLVTFSFRWALASAAAALLAVVVGWQVLSSPSPEGSVATTTALGQATVPENAFVLETGRFRSRGTLPTLSRSRDVGTVSFLLDMAENDAERYLVVIRDPDAREIWSRGELLAIETVERISLAFEVPMSSLDPGDYYVELYGADPSEPVARFDFRVATP